MSEVTQLQESKEMLEMVLRQMDEEVEHASAQTEQMNMETFLSISSRFKSFCESLVCLLVVVWILIYRFQKNNFNSFLYIPSFN